MLGNGDIKLGRPKKNNKKSSLDRLFFYAFLNQRSNGKLVQSSRVWLENKRATNGQRFSFHFFLFSQAKHISIKQGLSLEPAVMRLKFRAYAFQGHQQGPH